MVFPAFDDPFSSHSRQFLGHVRAFKIQVIRQLLSVEWNIKFRGVFFK